MFNLNTKADGPIRSAFGGLRPSALRLRLEEVILSEIEVWTKYFSWDHGLARCG